MMQIRFRHGLGVVVLASATERQTILWQPLESWAGECNEATRAVITAWSTNSPPPYMVVDLRRDEVRPDAAEPRVRYYISTNALPHGGLTNDVYRNAYMAMRLIPAQGRTFKMGSPSTGTSPPIGPWSRMAAALC